MRKVPTLLVVSAALLVLTLALTATGCGSDEVNTTQTTTAGETQTTAALEPTTTATSVEAMAATTTTAWSRPMTTELPPGATRLENGSVQVAGYIVEAHAGGPSRFNLVFVPAPLLADEDDVAAVLGGIVRSTDPRVTGYSFYPTVSITVSTLGDGGEQSLTLEEFLSIWSPSPPEGGEHLAYVLWSIEYGEDSLVVSITEVTS